MFFLSLCISTSESIKVVTVWWKCGHFNYSINFSKIRGVFDDIKPAYLLNY